LNIIQEQEQIELPDYFSRVQVMTEAPSITTTIREIAMEDEDLETALLHLNSERTCHHRRA